jgi:hypothetical protein
MPLDDNTAESTDDITATATAPRPNNATTFGQRCSMTNGKTNDTSSVTNVVSRHIARLTPILRKIEDSINNYMMHACTKEKEKYTE